MAMNWKYVIKKGKDGYAVHEDCGEYGYTDDSVFGPFDSKKELLKNIQWMLDDCS